MCNSGNGERMLLSSVYEIPIKYKENMDFQNLTAFPEMSLVRVPQSQICSCCIQVVRLVSVKGVYVKKMLLL